MYTVMSLVTWERAWLAFTSPQSLCMYHVAHWLSYTGRPPPPSPCNTPGKTHTGLWHINELSPLTESEGEIQSKEEDEGRERERERVKQRYLFIKANVPPSLLSARLTWSHEGAEWEEEQGALSSQGFTRSSEGGGKNRNTEAEVERGEVRVCVCVCVCVSTCSGSKWFREWWR